MRQFRAMKFKKSKDPPKSVHYSNCNKQNKNLTKLRIRPNRF